MSESKHTAEPWQYHRGQLFVNEHEGQLVIGECNTNFPELSVANARRIVACVNSCAGISTENLEDNLPVKELADRYNAVLKQRDELLEALELQERQNELAAKQQWIDPNDKTQPRYLPHIGEPVLFCHQGKTYYGLHTGGSFKAGHGVTAKLFGTWDCMWMPLPEPADTRVDERGDTK